MILDITGIALVPGELGRDCPGNGEVPGIECCCEECDYLWCCGEEWSMEDCVGCGETECPRKGVFSH